MVTVLNMKDAIYSKFCIHWHQLINTVVFLRTDHRFIEDPKYGEIVERFCNSMVTKENIALINSHLIHDHNGNEGVIDLPNDVTSDMYYTYETNAERNSITTSIFRDDINLTHPKENSEVDLREVPDNVVIIKSAIFDKNNERCSVSFESQVYNKCHDTDVMTDRNKHVDPLLVFHQ